MSNVRAPLRSALLDAVCTAFGEDHPVSRYGRLLARYDALSMGRGDDGDLEEMAEGLEALTEELASELRQAEQCLRDMARKHQ